MAQDLCVGLLTAPGLGSAAAQGGSGLGVVNETRASGNQHLNLQGGEEKHRHGKYIKISFQLLESV